MASAQTADGPVPANEPVFGPSLEDAWEIGNSAVAAEDWSRAWSIFHPLAERGRAGAAWQVAEMLYNGKGVKRDRQQAFFWYHKAAEQYLLPAMRRVAAMHQQGDGTERSAERAAFWYFAAAQAQDAESAFQLARHYEAGLGVDQNMAVAMGWYAKAAQAGYQPALDRLAEIVSRQKRLDSIPQTARDDILAGKAPTLPEMPWPETVTPYDTSQPLSASPSGIAVETGPEVSGPAPDLFTNPDNRPDENQVQPQDQEKQSTGPAFSLFLNEQDNQDTSTPD